MYERKLFAVHIVRVRAMYLFMLVHTCLGFLIGIHVTPD